MSHWTLSHWTLCSRYSSVAAKVGRVGGAHTLSVRLPVGMPSIKSQLDVRCFHSYDPISTNLFNQIATRFAIG